MSDDRGVLGNLPNSRPGRRSAKRPAAPGATSPRPAPASPERPRRAEQTDRVGGAIRTATGIATAGARAANGVARELVRRLPRP